MEISVAFSFAGEQRELVEAIATAVENDLGEGAVFYDEWYSAYLNNAESYERLMSIYTSESELVVTCISEDHRRKPWTTEERRAINGRRMRFREVHGELEYHEEFVLRVGKGTIKEMPYTTISYDARNRIPEEVAATICAKLRLAREVKSLDTATSTAPKPVVVPPERFRVRSPKRLVWPVLALLTAALMAWIVFQPSPEVRFDDVIEFYSEWPAYDSATSEVTNAHLGGNALVIAPLDYSSSFLAAPARIGDATVTLTFGANAQMDSSQKSTAEYFVNQVPNGDWIGRQSSYKSWVLASAGVDRKEVLFEALPMLWPDMIERMMGARYLRVEVVTQVTTGGLWRRQRTVTSTCDVDLEFLRGLVSGFEKTCDDIASPPAWVSLPCLVNGKSEHRVDAKSLEC
ncbi:hypothetical protein C7S18_09590 [Ahniella affigens]|uniref:TIR domain-containing protein n=1 Tax=Ahniella affigens TaxID=2021234 RepID=A0A2P1PRI6_9GAMM|nr:hypothetical protein [Ahniella affigens]AVP97432.1 hypothetical protein C7S18_09590 [Ahniella affigens]